LIGRNLHNVQAVGHHNPLAIRLNEGDEAGTDTEVASDPGPDVAETDHQIVFQCVVEMQVAEARNA